MGLIFLKAQWMGANQDFQMDSLLSTVSVSGWKPLLRLRRAKATDSAQPSSLKCYLALKLEGPSLTSQALGQHMPDQKNLTGMTSVGMFGWGSIFRILTFDLTSIISKQAADQAPRVDLTAWNTSHWEGTETQLSSGYPIAVRFCGVFCHWWLQLYLKL